MRAEHLFLASAFAFLASSAHANATEVRFDDWMRSYGSALEPFELGRDGKAGGLLSMKGEYGFDTEDGRMRKISGVKMNVGRLTTEREKVFTEAESSCARWMEKPSAFNGRTVVQVCDLLKNRKAYFEKYVDACIAEAATFQDKEVDDAIARLDEKGIAREEQVARFSAATVAVPAVEILVKGTGRPAPAGVAATSEKNRKRFLDALTKAGASGRWPSHAKGTDKAIVAAVGPRLDKRGMKLVKFGLYESAWNIRRNGYGVPIERKQLVGVMAKKKGESFCRIYDLEASQDHQGGGKYGATLFYETGWDSFVVTKC
jgi:hypothetical protein